MIFSEIFRFSIVGVLNTSATLAVIYGLMISGINPYISNFIGYAVGLTISFTMNRRWTFRAGSIPGLQVAGPFLAAVAAAYLANLTIFHVLIKIGISPYFSQLAGMPVYTICFFLLVKFFVFKSTNEDQTHQAERFHSR